MRLDDHHQPCRNSTKKITYASPSSEGEDLIDDNIPAPSSSKGGKAATKKDGVADCHSCGSETPEITPPTPHIADPGPEFTHHTLRHPPTEPTTPSPHPSMDLTSLSRYKFCIYSTIAQNTNSYAVVKRHELDQIAGRPSKYVTVGDIGRWRDIVIYVGVCCTPAAKNY